MKAGLITVFILVMAGSLSGCGQKGPLYQDKASQAEAEESASPERTEPDSTEPKGDEDRSR